MKGPHLAPGRWVRSHSWRPFASAAGGLVMLGCGMGQIGAPSDSSSILVGNTSPPTGAAATAGASPSSDTPAADAATTTSASPASAASQTSVVTGPRPQMVCSPGQGGMPAYQMVRRLSQDEYNNTLIDVFGADPTTWETIQFVGDITQSGEYETYSDGLIVTQPLIAALVDATFTTAQSLLNGPQASTLLVPPCTTTNIDASCAEAMVQTYGYRLFRRPITDSEISNYVSLFTQGFSNLALAPIDALAGTLAALMQSPNTLYIPELGSQQQATTYHLGPYEIASVLSYGLTGSAPSKAMLDSAGAGALDTPDGITTAAQTLIESPAGQAHVSNFFQAWLGYDGVPYAVKDPTVYNFPNSIATAMVQETQTFVDGIYQNGGALSDLLLSPQTFVNQPLAAFYGWSTDGLTATDFLPQPRPAGQGLGILAQGSFLARLATTNSSSPTQRGLFILTSLLCKNMPSPPPGVPALPIPTGTVTTRERYEDQHDIGSCKTCHDRIDQIGFGLENFDGIARYRTTEVGEPIDASGEILDLGGVTFDGPAQLAQTLASAPDTGQCLAAQLTAYVIGVSVNDGLCIAPPTAYSSNKQSLSNVLGQIVEPNHLVLRTSNP